jgi:1-deoxy-D-xylulose-5-phosphate reductoisomerase
VFAVGHLDFEQPDLERFPCLSLAYQAATAGGASPAILNAANEVAVQAFLQRRLEFTAIARIIDATMQQISASPVGDLESLLWIDQEARRVAASLLPGATSG